MTEPDYTIESLVAEVCERFGDDPSAPAVLVSRLPSEEWYMSVQRFTEAFEKGRQVIVSEKDLSSKMCLSLLWQRWETWKKSVDSVRKDYARRDAMQTVALAVEAKKNKYNSGPKSPAWQPVPSVTGTRGEVDLEKEIAKAGIIQEMYEDRAAGRGLFEQEMAQVRKWVPREMIYSAQVVFWHEPGGAVLSLKNKGSRLAKLTRAEASAYASDLGNNLVICAFPCGYGPKEFRVQASDSARVYINGEEVTGMSEVSFKKSKVKKPSLVPKVAGSRFNVLEVDDEEDE